jgi:UDP-N-acetylglucosamine--N-acetylmuramyl-(pentapeptide) pyrophosphoryl-undecaprenol N-acetylglucosamine transferase
MVIGGSQGAAGINTLVRDALPELLEDFQVVHICGKDKIDNLLLNVKDYKQFEFVKDDLKDIFAMADIVISRAGANAICELLALKKPNLLIPLPAAASRGDQILNAKSFESQGYSMVADEDYLTGVTLTEKVHELYFTRQEYIDAMRNSKIKDSIESIVGLIEDLT